MSYVEVKYDVWIMCGCSCVDCDRFVLYNIFWCMWQAGAKIYIVCWILWVCRIIWWRVKRAGIIKIQAFNSNSQPTKLKWQFVFWNASEMFLVSLKFIIIILTVFIHFSPKRTFFPVLSGLSYNNIIPLRYVIYQNQHMNGLNNNQNWISHI